VIEIMLVNVEEDSDASPVFEMSEHAELPVSLEAGKPFSVALRCNQRRRVGLAHAFVAVRLEVSMGGEALIDERFSRFTLVTPVVALFCSAAVAKPLR
jgi:hypothetical protein